MRFFIGILFASLFTFAANAQDFAVSERIEESEFDRHEYGGHHQHLRDQARGHLNSPHPSWRGVIYVLEGGTIELPDGKQVPFPTGIAAVNVRDVPHGAFKVVGDKTVKLLTVHIVDKGKPLYDKPPPK